MEHDNGYSGNNQRVYLLDANGYILFSIIQQSLRSVKTSMERKCVEREYKFGYKYRISNADIASVIYIKSSTVDRARVEFEKIMDKMLPGKTIVFWLKDIDDKEAPKRQQAEYIYVSCI